MKIVINKCYGGFGLSKEAQELYSKYAGVSKCREYDLVRNDPHLVRVVEELKENADGQYSELKVVDIPDDVEYTIEEYDGQEWIAEKHRTWN